MSPQRARKLNLNLATEEELQAIPGIGRITARRIVASRQTKRFEQTADLMRVRGFSQVLYEAVAGLVFVEAGAEPLDPASETVAFGLDRPRTRGKAIPPIDFFGTPRELTGVVPLVNTGTQPVRLTAIALEKTTLRAPNGVTLKEVPLRKWMQPGELAGAPIGIALDPRTAPGTYEAEFVLGKKRHPVVFHVAEVVKLRIVPERLIIDNRPGSKTAKTLFATNLGNVNIEIGDIGVVGLEEDNLICNTIREAVSLVKEPDLDSTVASFVTALNKSFQESRALTVRTQGKPILILPGETASLELEFTLPRTLRRRHIYFGSMRLYNVSIPIVLQPMGGAGEKDNSD